MNSPARCNGCERFKDKGTMIDLQVRDIEAARSNGPAAPQCDIQIKNARAPAPAWAASEFSLELLKLEQHLVRLK